MRPLTELKENLNRRQFFGRTSLGLGSMALGSMLKGGEAAGRQFSHFAPKAKRVIYLFQSGGPAQMDLFDYKPGLQERFGQEVPKSVYPDERKTTMTSAQTSFPVAPSKFKFTRQGQGGVYFTENLPYLASVADELCVVKSMYTQAINHDPAITLLQTGSQIPGRPSIGSWLSYGLGAETSNLPTFVAMSSRGRGRGGQPLYDRLWGSGFLPSHHQGVKFRNNGAPVLDIYDPKGVDRGMRRQMLDGLAELNELKFSEYQDPEIRTRIAQYELAYQMQMSVPELLDFGKESKHVIESYGPDVHKQGTYAYNCLMARRLAERGVRFVQLFHQGWDQHTDLPKQISGQCKDVDQPTAALIQDLKSRGMLEDTLIVWGGEFGRTVYSQGKATPEKYGRDHHPGCFSVWLAGGGIQGGMDYGETDDYSVNVVNGGVHVHDLHATMLHLLGFDHERLSFKFQGRDFRLTDVEGKIVRALLS
jgi:hypothetical protein